MAEPHPIDRIARPADTLPAGSKVFPAVSGDARIESGCNGTACAFTALGEDAAAAAETRRGVPLARVRRTGAIGG